MRSLHTPLSTSRLFVQNLGRVRHIAMNYLKGETRFKGGVRRKQKKAALDDTYLADVLAV